MTTLIQHIKMLEAGGPGSGRKPEWQKGTSDFTKLNELHQQLRTKEFKFSHSSDKHPDDPKGVIRHTYSKNERGKGSTKYAQLFERANGEHSIKEL